MEVSPTTLPDSARTADAQHVMFLWAEGFFRDFRDAYVAVLDMTIVGSGNDEDLLRQRLADKHGEDPRHFAVAYIGE